MLTFAAVKTKQIKTKKNSVECKLTVNDIGTLQITVHTNKNIIKPESKQDFSFQIILLFY